MIVALVMTVALSLAFRGSPERKGAGDGRAVLQKLESLREENWTTKIHTLRAEVEYLRLQEGNNKTISHETFDKFVRGLKDVWSKTKSLSNLRDYSETLPIGHPENFPNCWLSGKIVQRSATSSGRT